MKRAVTAILLMALGAPLVMLRAQQQTPPGPAAPVFRSGTRLIVENVTVKDKNGTPVEGLTAKDFTVTEDGEPQAITFVEFQRLASPAVAAAALAQAAEPAPDAQLNLRPTVFGRPTYDFVEKERGGHRHVERLYRAAHRDGHAAIGLCHQRGRKACALAAQQKGQRKPQL